MSRAVEQTVMNWLLVVGCLGRLAAAEPSQLTLLNPTIHQYEDGPPISVTDYFVPGETVFLSFQVDGYTTRIVDEEPVVHLKYRIEAVDYDGILLDKPLEAELKQKLTYQDKDWKPKIRYSVVVPPLALSGTYQIRATVTDMISKRTATTSATFRVRARDVPASDHLVIRNFRFLHSESDEQPLLEPVYRAGEFLWARFDITGYKHGPENLIDIQYGVRILDENDQEVYNNYPAVHVTEGSFYPKRYLPGIFSIEIQPGTEGTYKLEVIVEDLIGNQKAIAQHSFQVRAQ